MQMTGGVGGAKGTRPAFCQIEMLIMMALIAIVAAASIPILVSQRHSGQKDGWLEQVMNVIGLVVICALCLCLVVCLLKHARALVASALRARRRPPRNSAPHVHRVCAGFGACDPSPVVPNLGAACAASNRTIPAVEDSTRASPQSNTAANAAHRMERIEHLWQLLLEFRRDYAEGFGDQNRQHQRNKDYKGHRVEVLNLLDFTGSDMCRLDALLVSSETRHLFDTLDEIGYLNYLRKQELLKIPKRPVLGSALRRGKAIAVKVPSELMLMELVYRHKFCELAAKIEDVLVVCFRKHQEREEPLRYRNLKHLANELSAIRDTELLRLFRGVTRHETLDKDLWFAVWFGLYHQLALLEGALNDTIDSLLIAAASNEGRITENTPTVAARP